MIRYLMNLLAGMLLVAGCSKSPTTVAPDPGQGGDLAERAKAEALKEFSLSWTNTGSTWASYTPPKKMLIQLTNLSVRVEVVELSDKQRAKGFTWGADVFFSAQLARNHSAKSGWSEWKPTIPLRYAVLMSNEVCVVENNFRKSFILPPVSQP
jgi:hypothetical protein